MRWPFSYMIVGPMGTALGDSTARRVWNCATVISSWILLLGVGYVYSYLNVATYCPRVGVFFVSRHARTNAFADFVFRPVRQFVEWRTEGKAVLLMNPTAQSGQRGCVSSNLLLVETTIWTKLGRVVVYSLVVACVWRVRRALRIVDSAPWSRVVRCVRGLLVWVLLTVPVFGSLALWNEHVGGTRWVPVVAPLAFGLFAVGVFVWAVQQLRAGPARAVQNLGRAQVQSGQVQSVDRPPDHPAGE